MSHLRSIAAWQEPDGSFHTALDDHDTCVESTAAAAFVFTALRARRMGIETGLPIEQVNCSIGFL